MADASATIVLTGRDVSASRVLAALGRQALETAAQVREVGEGLDRVARNVTARIKVDVTPRTALTELRQAIDRLNRTTTVRVRVALGSAMRDLDRLGYALNELQYREQTEVNITVDIDSTAEVRELNTLLDRIERDIRVRIRVDEDGGGGAGGEGGGAGRLGRLSESLQAVTRSALTTTAGLAALGAKGGAGLAGLAGGLQAVATLGQVLSQAGAAAGIAAPAILTMVQAQGTLKLVTEAATRELERYKPQFDGIKKAAEEAFSPKFREALKIVSGSFPVISEGVEKTAQVFGQLSVEAARVFSGKAFNRDLEAIMDTNAEATLNLGRAGISMAGAFWDVAIAAKDVWLNFTHLIEVGARQVALWVEAKRESGELTESIRRGAETVGNLVTGLFDFGAGIKALFSAINGDTKTTAQGFADMAASFRGWAESVGTQTAITTFFQNLRTVAGLAKQEVVALADQFAQGLNTGQVNEDASGLSLVFQTLGVRAGDVARLFRDELWPTLQTVGAFIRDDVLPIVSELSLIFSDTLNAAIATVARIIRDDLVPVFESMAPIVRDVIVPAIRDLATWCQDNLFPAVEQVAASIRDDLKPAFDSIYTTIMDNKAELKLLWQALQDIATIILTVVAFAIENNLGSAVKAATLAIQACIEAAAQFVVAVLNLASAVLGAAIEIIQGFKNIVDAAIGMVSGVISVMAKLPGPLGAPWKEAEKAINAFRTTVNTDLTTAEGRVRDAQTRINGFLDGIRDKTVTITLQERRFISEQVTRNSANGLIAAGAGTPARAAGGPVEAGQPYMTGEAGRELFVPYSDGYIFDAATTARMARQGPRAMAMAGGGTTYVTNNYYTIEGSVVTERRLAEVLAVPVRDAMNSRISKSNGRRTGL
ncbi:hypothetical protein BBK14_01780 [Parafrankia soli]|uniref:Uncharacterized protein n=1 Tax=Parafrankia soli TaxID=2599596 RepID=A0A1S1RMS3_9ACTN|nr:hypothetical protein [Parafrankia soli]OHV46602.1 hypothetical protein BBK14_01780 [Parafrankia soli]